MSPLTDKASGARRATVEQASRPPEDWIVRYYLRPPTIPGSQWTLVDTSRYERQDGAAVAAEHFLAGGGSDLR